MAGASASDSNFTRPLPAAFALAGVLAAAAVALAAPSRNTDRRRSGRSSSSAVAPEKRISPFSMK